MSTKRIAVVGPEAQAQPVIVASRRLPDVECVWADGNSNDENFDAVVCCRGCDDVVRAIHDLAKSGTHVLLDHATLTAERDIDAVINASSEAGASLTIVSPRRFLPSVQVVRQSLDAGQLGAAGLCRIHRWVSGADNDIDQLLLDEIDLAVYLFDGLPTTVYAVAQRSGDAARFTQVHLGFTGGGMALVDVATALPDGEAYYSLSLIGSTGAAYADDHHDMQLVFGGGKAAAERTRDDALVWLEPLRRLAAEMDASSEPAARVDSARAALGVTAAVRRSIETGSALERQGDRYEPA